MKKRSEEGFNNIKFIVRKHGCDDVVVDKGLLLENKGLHSTVHAADVDDVDIIRFGCVILQMVCERGLQRVFMKILEDEFKGGLNGKK